MAWTNDDGTHEGYVAAVGPDGGPALGAGGAGVLVEAPEDSSEARRIVAEDQIIGWRGACTCGWSTSFYSRAYTGRMEYTIDAPFDVETDAYSQWRAHIALLDASAGSG